MKGEGSRGGQEADKLSDKCSRCILSDTCFLPSGAFTHLQTDLKEGPGSPPGPSFLNTTPHPDPNSLSLHIGKTGIYQVIYCSQIVQQTTGVISGVDTGR